MDIRFKLAVVILFCPLFCNVLLPSGRTVYYNADKISVEFNKAGEPAKVSISGNVNISFDDIVINCESAVFNKTAGEIIAEGGITAETSQGVFKADRLEYMIYEERGFLFNASFSSPPLYGKAEKIERDREVLFIHKGYITTCNREKPHYRFFVDRIEYKADDYLRAEKMKLVFGEKLNVFYFPRLTIDAKTKEPPFLVSSGHSTKIGKTVDMIFQHRTAKDTDAIMREKVSIGTKAIGFGPEIESAEHRYKASAFFAKLWEKSGLEYGLFAEYYKNFASYLGKGNIILDWRLMYDNDFFYDFFYNTYLKKSKMYNRLSFTQNFNGGIFNAEIRADAGEEFLNIEKLPELRFYTPSFKIPGTPVFFENDLRATNFYKEKEYCLRSMDIVTLKTRKEKSGFVLSPYLSFAGVDYRRSDENRFNFMWEAGTRLALLMQKEHERVKEYFVPSLALFHRHSRYKKGELEYFDRTELMEEGNFANLSADWSFWSPGGSVGQVAVENLYDIGNNSLEENILKYDVKISQNIHITGNNEWNAGRRKYLFGVNDIILDSSKYRCSFGTRYDDEGDIFGITAGFQHNAGDLWRYSLQAHYDIDAGSFARQSAEFWKRLHCWELNFKIERDAEDFSFYIFAYPVFI